MLLPGSSQPDSPVPLGISPVVYDGEKTDHLCSYVLYAQQSLTSNTLQISTKTGDSLHREESAGKLTRTKTQSAIL